MLHPPNNRLSGSLSRAFAASCLCLQQEGFSISATSRFGAYSPISGNCPQRERISWASAIAERARGRHRQLDVHTRDREAIGQRAWCNGIAGGVIVAKRQGRKVLSNF